MDTASWVYEYYSKYAKESLFYDPKEQVKDVNTDFLNCVTEVFDTIVNNAVENNLGDTWLVDSLGTVTNGEIGLFVSPIDGIPSGLYSVGIRYDGSKTLIDADVDEDSCFGIRGTYQGSNVDYLLSVNVDENNTVTMGFGQNYVRLADNDGKITNSVDPGQLDNLKMAVAPGQNSSQNQDGDEENKSGGMKFTYGHNEIGTLSIDFDGGTVSASGEGTVIAINFWDPESGYVSTENATTEILAPGAIIRGGLEFSSDFDGDSVSDQVNMNFNSGYLAYNGVNFDASKDFSAVFGDQTSVDNYGKYVAQQEGLVFDSVEPMSLDTEFHCNPFDY